MASAVEAKSAGEPGPRHNIDAAREAYYGRIAKHGMAPLWKVMKSVVTKEPVTRCVPVVWHYQDVKPLVMESGALISAEEAQRRSKLGPLAQAALDCFGPLTQEFP